MPNPQSSVLQWAFGCTARHPFLLQAMQLLADRVLAWQPSMDGGTAESALFAARTGEGQRGALVNVLEISGPALVTAALRHYGHGHEYGERGRDLKALRHQFGERDGDQSSWAFGTKLVAASASSSASDSTPLPPVFVLPYCFFRSRGCGHLDRFDDQVLFHHEFDTSWRTSFWQLV